MSQLSGGLKPSISAYFLKDTSITLSENDQVKVGEFDQFVVTCYNKTTDFNTNSSKPEDIILYQRAFAGFAKQEVSNFSVF